ncbi:MAG: hypothetical protein ACLGGX_02800 [Bdellovibrionia bacterium]
MKYFFYSVAVAVISFVVAYQMNIQKNGYLGPNRNPAAIQRTYDFSHLSGESLVKAAKTRLISALRIEKNDELQALSLGHFVFEDAGGIRRYACEHYEKVQLIFEADGVASSGQSPEMIIEGRCNFSPNDIGYIQPLVIPVARITGDMPTDGEYKFEDYENQLIQFKHMADQWPSLWVLKKVSLSKGVDELIVPAEEVGQLVGRPIVVKF